LIAFGCVAAVWLILGLYLQRAEFKGAPKHIEYIDPYWRTSAALC
jgi:hypothetical protein